MLTLPPMDGTRRRRAAAFIGALGLVLLYALRGGAYDIVVRDEHAVWILAVLVIGLAFGVLPRRATPLRALAPLAALALLAVLTVIGLGHTSSQDRTANELARVLHHAAVYALPLCFLSRRTWTAAAAGLATGVLAVSAIALLARLDPGLLGEDVVARAFHTDRMSYPLGYWNAVGAWSATAVVLGLVWSAHARAPWLRGLALAAVPVAALATYLTYSRGAVVSVVLGVLVGVAFARHRAVLLVHALVAGATGAVAILVVRGKPEVAHATGTAGRSSILLVLLAAGAVVAAAGALTGRLGARLRPRAPIGVLRGATAAATVALLVLAIVAGPGLAHRAYRSYRDTGPVAASADPAARLANLSGTRYLLWSSALDAYRSSERRGIGPGAFGFWWNREGRGPEFVRDAHSLYLQSLAEMGWPGLLAILLLLGSLAFAAVSPRSGKNSSREAGALAGVAATLAIFAWSAGVDWMWQSTANASLALGSAGVAAVALSHRGARLRWPVRVLLVLVAVIALVVQLPSLVGTSTVRASQAAARRGDLEAAFARAQDGVSVEPWAGSPYVQRALILESQGRLGDALVDIRRAIAREPDEWTDRLVLARIQAERGNARAALAAFAEARRLRPRSAVFAGLTGSAGSP